MTSEAPTAATSKLTPGPKHSRRHFHDPGARRIFVHILKAAPSLKTHTRALAGATNATQGAKPAPGGPKADPQQVLRAIGAARGDLRHLVAQIRPVRCRTESGRRGKKQLLAAFAKLDLALTTFATSVTTADRSTKGKLGGQSVQLNKQAQSMTKAALNLLQR